MRLIAAEDYADWQGIKIQDVYLLMESGKLRSVKQLYGGLKRQNLIYVDYAPSYIPSLDASVEYLNQKKAAYKLGITADLLRKHLRNNDIKSVTIKGFSFIPMNQFDNNNSVFSGNV